MSFLKMIIISPLTQNSHHLVILDDLQWPRHHETQAVHALSSVVDQVTGGAVDGLELHGQSSEAAVAGQTESWVLFENLPVEMDADVRPHVLWTNLQHLETEDRRGTDRGVGPRMESRFLFFIFPFEEVVTRPSAGLLSQRWQLVFKEVFACASSWYKLRPNMV